MVLPSPPFSVIRELDIISKDLLDSFLKFGSKGGSRSNHNWSWGCRGGLWFGGGYTLGILGKITAVNENFISLEVSRDIILYVQKSSVQSIMPKGTIKEQQ